MNKVYVGNLPYQASEDELQGVFSQAGEVTDIRIIIDRETRRSKGFGFVTYADEAAAQKAVETLDGQDFNGRPLRVSIARERERA